MGKERRAQSVTFWTRAFTRDDTANHTTVTIRTAFRNLSATAAHATSHAAAVGFGCMIRRQYQQAIGRGTDEYQVTGIHLAAATYTAAEHWTDVLCVVRVSSGEAASTSE